MDINSIAPKATCVSTLGFPRNDRIFAKNLRNFRANIFLMNFSASFTHEAL